VKKSITDHNAFNELKEGIVYCIKNQQIRFLLLISFVVSVVGISYATLLPDIAISVLHGDSKTNGWLQSSRGMGALIGALVVASIGVIKDRSRLLMIGVFAFPITLLAFAVSNQLFLSLVLLMIIGLGVMIVFNSLNVFLHSIVLDQYRGRVMSIYTLTFFGGAPLGGLVIGSIAEIYGSRLAIIMMAVLSIGFAFYTRVNYKLWKV
jgi:MFS family permease